MKRIVSFFEIPAADFKRAVTFYESVLNLKLSVLECETEKMACFPKEDGLAPGAISWAPGFEPSREGVLLSLSCDSIDATLKRVAANGGKVTHPKAKIEAEGRGYFATFTDSEGNTLGLYADS